MIWELGFHSSIPVNKEDFFLKVIEFSEKEGFYFLPPSETAAHARTMSDGRQTVFRVISGAVFGMLGGLSTGCFDVPSRQQLATDLRRMNDLCDLVGINLTNGPVILRLAIDTDDIDDGSIVSLFPRIHELSHGFQRYGLSIAGGGKMAVRSQVLLAFTSHARATAFCSTLGPTCKQFSFWKKVYTEAWVADLEAAEITRFRHGGELLARDLPKRKAGFFQARS